MGFEIMSESEVKKMERRLEEKRREKRRKRQRKRRKKNRKKKSVDYDVKGTLSGHAGGTEKYCDNCGQPIHGEGHEVVVGTRIENVVWSRDYIRRRKGRKFSARFVESARGENEAGIICDDCHARGGIVRYGPLSPYISPKIEE